MSPLCSRFWVIWQHLGLNNSMTITNIYFLLLACNRYDNCDDLIHRILDSHAEKLLFIDNILYDGAGSVDAKIFAMFSYRHLATISRLALERWASMVLIVFIYDFFYLSSLFKFVFLATEMVKYLQGSYGVAGNEQFTVAMDFAQTYLGNELKMINGKKINNLIYYLIYEQLAKLNHHLRLLRHQRFT